MSSDAAVPRLVERNWAGACGLGLRLVLALLLLAIVVQAAIVVHARPQDLITGARGMADIIRRAVSSDLPVLFPTWFGRCSSSPPSGSGHFLERLRFPFIRSECSAASSPRRSSIWTWRPSTPLP